MESIGEGGFSTVHSGFDHNGKKVAIKKINEDVKEIWREREINANSLLKHENIAKMENFYRDENDLYIVFEYIEGTDLDETRI